MLMLNEPQRDLLRDHGTKTGRFLMGFLFVGGALSMLFLTGPENVAAYFGGIGLPESLLLVWLVIIFKIVAGMMVILGYRIGLASMLLIGFTAVATLLAHQSFSDPGLLKNLAIIGGLLYVMAFGPGGTNIKLVRVDKEPGVSNVQES